MLGLWAGIILSIALLLTPGFFLGLLIIREQLGWLVRMLVSLVISAACWIIVSFYLSAIGLKLTRPTLIAIAVAIIGLVIAGYYLRSKHPHLDISIRQSQAIRLGLGVILIAFPIFYLYSTYTYGELINYPSWSELRTLHKGDLPSESQALIDANLLAGSVYLDLGQYDQAMEAFARVLIIQPDMAEELRMEHLLPFLYLHPDDPFAFFLRAESYYAQNKIGMAFLDYQKVIAISPQSYAGYLAQARLFQINGDHDHAITKYRQAVGKSPESFAANVWLGQSYLQVGLYTDAIDAFRNLLQLWTDNKVVHAMVYQAQGDLYQSEGKTGMALAMYRKGDALREDTREHVYTVPAEHLSFKYYNFLEHMNSAPKTEQDPGHIRQGMFFIDNVRAPVLFQHPPSSITYTVNIPADSQLQFQMALSPQVWNIGKGDGVQFMVTISSNKIKYIQFSTYIDPKNILADRHWFYKAIDLNDFAGQEVQVTFTTLPGPNSDDRFDWAGWGQPRITQQAYYDFIEQLSRAVITDDIQQIHQDWIVINNDLRDVVFQHPPSQILYQDVAIADNSTLHFGLGIDPHVWSSDKGDGVEYNVYIRNPKEPFVLRRVFNRYIDPKHNPDNRRWLDQTVDLRKYGGQTVDIIFEALSGPSGDASFDWGGWSNPVLVDSPPYPVQNTEN